LIYKDGAINNHSLASDIVASSLKADITQHKITSTKAIIMAESSTSQQLSSMYHTLDSLENIVTLTKRPSTIQKLLQ
jgi:hypothetical protein